MLITAHRGASGQYPENTMEAFMQALAMGATAIELDVRRCASGEIVVIHDETVNRTTDGTGNVAELTLAELNAMRTANDETIPTLEAVFAAVAGKATIFVEMKDSAISEVAACIHRAVKEHGFTYATLPVISFSHSILTRLKLKNPHIQIGLTYGGKHPKLERSTMIPMAKTLGASGINPNHQLVTPELVATAHRAKLTVNTWTVNHPDAIRRMIDCGVDALMSDYPDRVVQALKA